MSGYSNPLEPLPTPAAVPRCINEGENAKQPEGIRRGKVFEHQRDELFSRRDDQDHQGGLVLIGPFLRLNNRIKELLEDKNRLKGEIILRMFLPKFG